MLAVQVILILVASGPESHWRGDGYVAISAAAALLSAVAALWSLWGLRSWPIALRVFVMLLHVPLLVASLLMSGF